MKNKIAEIIGTIIGAILAGAISWAICALVLWVICACFHAKFNFITATGIWLVLGILRYIFRK